MVDPTHVYHTGPCSRTPLYMYSPPFYGAPLPCLWSDSFRLFLSPPEMKLSTSTCSPCAILVRNSLMLYPSLPVPGVTCKTSSVHLYLCSSHVQLYYSTVLTPGV